MQNKNLFLWLMVIIQIACASAFTLNLALSLTKARDTPMSDTLSIAASVGLVLGTILAIRMLFNALRARHNAELALRNVSSAFVQVVNEKFEAWGFTKAEWDVAWFVVKGFSIKEIANLRGSSDGTIKAQCNAIYRKVGVSGRTQLMSQLVEDLLLDRD